MASTAVPEITAQPVTPRTMAAIQWSSGTLLSENFLCVTLSICLKNVNNMQQLDASWVSVPEYTKGNLDYTTASQLLWTQFEGVKTPSSLIYGANMYSAYYGFVF